MTWFRAFGQGLMVALAFKLGVPEDMISMIKTFYIKPQFRIKDREGKSTYRTQRAVIQQGCPLSPYLFTSFMMVMLHNIHNDIESVLSGKTPDYLYN